MHSFGAVAMLLASSLTAAAQDTISADVNLLDRRLPAVLATEEGGEQGKQDETRTVTSDKLQDELPVGPYRRPMWTLHRVSPTTRIYLQVDPGEVEFEQWLDIRLRKKRSEPDDRIRMAQELEFGLGGRFQLDLYMNTIWTKNSGTDATLATRSWAAELRYALADWGVLWGNPTLYLEYILWNNEPNGHGDEATASIEPKLLLGGEIAAGWHWGANFFYERTFNNSVREHGVTASVLHTIVDRIFTAGLTAKFVYESDNIGSSQAPAGNSERSHELYIGPTFQFRMANRDEEMEVNGVKTKVTRAKAHLDLEPIFGCTGDSSRVQFLIVFGWDF
ncbi:MAG: hypothetical protein JO332_06390 [Planctomycetaceae bacterium]|nr:hypothetical protein [Planctomycetaceae bacterium]